MSVIATKGKAVQKPNGQTKETKETKKKAKAE